MDYEYNDSEIVFLIRDGDEESSSILFKKYEPYIKSVVSKMAKYCNNTGIDENDLFQEGMLGLNNAIRTFDDSRDTIFYTYAKHCIERSIISAIVATKRLKHKALNDSIVLDDTDRTDIFVSASPENVLIENESETELFNSIRSKLTGFEEQVFLLKVSGLNYKEIAEILDKDSKAIDNALQRVKLKVKDILKTR